MHYQNIREEELKNKVADDFFKSFDCSRIIGNIDFCVTMKKYIPGSEVQSLLWAEAKKGKSDLLKSLTQLILTIGKARTFDKSLPPAYLGAFDSEKIAFIPYNKIQDVFYINDFNWNVAPSDYNTKEFRLIFEKVKNEIESSTLNFNFKTDNKELKEFIRANFNFENSEISKIQIDKNNFVVVYNKWLNKVKPTISVNWDVAKQGSIIDGDFYLADLLSGENKTLKENLFVVLEYTQYRLNRHKDKYGIYTSSTVEFNDGQKAYNEFWSIYHRPPMEEYWDYIIDRRDLLVPQDIRERKGSFYTPQIWVELSQKYLTDVLGKDWQDEYYIWDCAAGTGNLLTGLTNKYNIWASTLDKQDVEVMKERIKNGANLLEEHVFQFDFLNDSFDKLPKPLFEIINNPEKRKKLVIYINPPYAEVGSKHSASNKDGVSKTLVSSIYSSTYGQSINELFAQFLIRIYCEIPDGKIANFSTLKNLQSSNFSKFRAKFHAKLKKLFLVPADSFDNVKGKFPIGFFIWDTAINEPFKKIVADVYDVQGFVTKKVIYRSGTSISKWIFEKLDEKNKIGHLSCRGSNDFQGQSSININSYLIKFSDRKNRRYRGTLNVDRNNLIKVSIFFAVRHCIQATWLNDRDQFLYPNDGWKKDKEFQNDCLAFTLFHSQNRISSKEGTNHWLPFTEYEINAKEKFESNFMTNFISGKLKFEENADLYNGKKITTTEKLIFSDEAKAVFNAGKELWKYYHSQSFSDGQVAYNVNASLYDIREHFQGRNEKGKMNNKSTDDIYNKLIAELKDKLKILAKKIEPKVYEYGFLKG